MKITIDATPIGVITKDKGGVNNYIFNLIQGLQRIDKANEYVIFFNFFRKEHLIVLNQTVKELNLSGNFKLKYSRIPPRIWQRVGVPVDYISGGFDIFHSPCDYLPTIRNGKAIVTIHDVRYLYPYTKQDEQWIDILKRRAPVFKESLEDYLGRGRFFDKLRENIQKTIDRASLIITVSHFTKDSLIRHLGVNEDKITVIYHGVSPMLSRSVNDSGEKINMVLSKFHIKGEYILYVGKFDPLKNLMVLLQAYKFISKRFDISLVLVGLKNWFYHIVEEEIEKLDISQKVIITDYVSSDELRILYAKAFLFILPSLYEGFGIPPIEAMSLGVPVVASRISSIPEIVGDAALLFNPYSVEDLVTSMEKVLQNEDMRKELSRKGRERVNIFTWERAAKETISVYERACSQRIG